MPTPRDHIGTPQKSAEQEEPSFERTEDERFAVEVHHALEAHVTERRLGHSSQRDQGLGLGLAR